LENCKIGELIKAVSGKMIQGDQGCLIEGISIDSRILIPGDLFFAIIGPNFDGHNFIIEAFKKGAVGAVVCKGASTLLQNEQIDKNFCPAGLVQTL
jgi:UDP-N-acetylmuramoyl-tripeptide--D-alanyl-D-alanine ligase